MKLLFLLSIVMLFIFSVYPDEWGIIEQSEYIDFSQEEIGENGTKNEEDAEPKMLDVYRPYELYGLWGNVAYSDYGLESKNVATGLNFTILNAPPGGMIAVFTMQTFGADYQYLGNKNGAESIFRLNYTYFGYFTVLGGGGGISTFYNISNNNIGIAPQIGLSVFFGYIIINYYYRYNVVLNNIKRNYHETVVSVNIGNMWIWRKK